MRFFDTYVWVLCSTAKTMGFHEIRCSPKKKWFHILCVVQFLPFLHSMCITYSLCGFVFTPFLHSMCLCVCLVFYLYKLGDLNCESYLFPLVHLLVNFNFHVLTGCPSLSIECINPFIPSVHNEMWKTLFTPCPPWSLIARGALQSSRFFSLVFLQRHRSDPAPLVLHTHTHQKNPETMLQ